MPDYQLKSIQLIKSFLDDEDSFSEGVYTDDIKKIVFNESKRRKYIELVNSITNQTSKEEMIKRLRWN